jgi:hypothetical protein
MAVRPEGTGLLKCSINRPSLYGVHTWRIVGHSSQSSGADGQGLLSPISDISNDASPFNPLNEILDGLRGASFVNLSIDDNGWPQSGRPFQSGPRQEPRPCEFNHSVFLFDSGAAEFLKTQFRFLAIGWNFYSWICFYFCGQVNAGMPLVAPLGPWYKEFLLVAEIQSSDTGPRSHKRRG